MDRNVGPEDRVVRIVVAIGLAIIIYMGVIDRTAAIVGGIVAAYLLVSGLLARCVIYKAAGLDTTPQDMPYTSTDDRAGL
jgi:hypothetical protein